MTTFEKRSAETTYDDRDGHHEQDSRREGGSHQQHGSPGVYAEES